MRTIARDSVRLSRTAGATRAKLLVLLPLMVALLVSATGFFTLNMASRAYASPNPRSALARLGVEVALITCVAALLGYGLAIGVTAPLREVTGKLGAIAAGDLRAALDIRSSAELDTLGSAFNEAIGALNRYVFQSMAGAVITLSPAGRVIGSSPAAEAILGYREDEIVGKQFSDVFAPAGGGGRAALAAIEAGIARRERVATSDAVIATKDGRQLAISLSVSYLRGERPDDGSGDDRHEDVVGVTIAFKDTTEVRHLRQHIQHADQLVALGTLTAGVAHELRNPLASMQGLVELLARDFELTDPRQTYANTILESIGRLNRLVEELLVFSSPVPSVIERVDLAALIRETVMFGRLGLTRRVQLDLTGDEHLDRAVVQGNPERLGRALTNILQNAVQATPEGGTVSVRAGVHDRRVTIAVHNTGSYIPPDRVKQLFVPFYTTKPGGTGLGLAIARQIVIAHGGHIDVDSAQGQGTTFAIELPLATLETERSTRAPEMAVARV